VLDNIAFALREQGTLPDAVVRDAAMVKLQMVGLKPEHASRMPADLSGGMIKRVALARALMMDPPLLLLDEPTAGLDPKGSDEFCELLRDIHAELGLTVIMVTHDLDTLFALSTRVAVLAEKKCCSPELRAMWPGSSTRLSNISSRESVAAVPWPRCKAAWPQRKADGKQVPCHGCRHLRAGGCGPAGRAGRLADARQPRIPAL
jgi:energy-coupling factor transporter ATP-binding protein EcfA2